MLQSGIETVTQNELEDCLEVLATCNATVATALAMVLLQHASYFALFRFLLETQKPILDCASTWPLQQQAKQTNIRCMLHAAKLVMCNAIVTTALAMILLRHASQLGLFCFLLQTQSLPWTVHFASAAGSKAEQVRCVLQT